MTDWQTELEIRRRLDLPDRDDKGQVREYTRNVGDAWLVIEKMLDLGWSYQMDNIAKESGGGHRAGFSKPGGRCGYVGNTSAAMAICREALWSLLLERESQEVA